MFPVSLITARRQQNFPVSLTIYQKSPEIRHFEILNKKPLKLKTRHSAAIVIFTNNYCRFYAFWLLLLIEYVHWAKKLIHDYSLKGRVK